MSSETAGRRTVLKYLLGAGAAGAVAVVGLSAGVARRASAQANVVFHDREVVLPVGGEVADVAVSGRIEGEYTVPSETADAASFEVALTHQGLADAAVSDVIEVGDVDPGGGTVTVDPSYSLVEGTSLSPSHFMPAGDGEGRSDSWEVAVRFAVTDGSGTTLAESEARDEAVVVVRPHPDEDSEGESGSDGDGSGGDEDDAEPAEGTVSGSFAYEVETA